MSDQIAVERGRSGGKKTAERGSDYFRRIAAARKVKRGGRPRKADNREDAYPIDRLSVAAKASIGLSLSATEVSELWAMVEDLLAESELYYKITAETTKEPL